MYEVAQGKNYAKITLSGSEVAVKFPNAHDVFAVKGENIQAALTAEAVAGADGTFNTADGDGQIIIAHYTHADTLYIKGTGTAIVWGGQAPEACPFKKQAKGGESVTVEPILITNNGTYTAPTGKAYSPVTVDVQEQPWQPLQDGYSNFWFELTDDTLSPWLNFSAKNNDAVIDWGDGSGEQSLDTLTPTHTYAKAGKYVVKVKGVTGIGRQHTAPYGGNYLRVLKHIELNDEVTNIGTYAFYRSCGLESISCNAILNGTDIFNAASCLSDVRISGITAIPNFCFSYVFCLYEYSIPATVTIIGASAFSYETSLRKIIIPSAITAIGNTAFQGCVSLNEIHVQATVPPTLGTNVFANLPSNYIIYVPQGTGETYKAAAGWSAYSDRILEEGQSVTRAMQSKFKKEAEKFDNDEVEMR